MTVGIRYAAHPAAALFPMLPDSELQELADDIYKNGLIEPIVLCDGAILDGRNRYAACELAGVDPRFVDFDGPSPTQFVISKNLHRRHLTHGQQTVIAVEAMPLFKEEARLRQQANQFGTVSTQMAPPDSKEVSGSVMSIAAAQAGVSHGSVQQAIVVKRSDPEAYERIRRGEVKVGTAYGAVVKKQSRTYRTQSQRADEIRELAATGHKAAQIADRLGLSVAHVCQIATRASLKLPDRFTRSPKLNPDRIVSETVRAAEASIVGLDLVDGLFDRLTVSEIPAWIESLTDSVHALNGLIKKLKQLGGSHD